MPKTAPNARNAATQAAKKIPRTPYAQLTLDWSFKRVFATPGHEHLLARLISSFLDGHLAAPIKTVTVLNTTYTAKTRKQRSAVFDLHCEDAKGNRFIVEMQLAKQDNFFERLLFYAAQCVTSLVKKGGMDFSIPRVYSLGFLNFIPENEIGTTDIVRHIGFVDLDHRQTDYPQVHISYVMLPRFTKSLEECDEDGQDIWLYLFRHITELKTIPPKLQKKWLDDLFLALKIANFTPTELRRYEASMKALNDYDRTIAYAGKEGFALGSLRQAQKMARWMLSKGMDMADIEEATGLSKPEILALQN
jgi:predicted transposase/invertase (TIGR01784 family)